jgi:hypothetical protein
MELLETDIEISNSKLRLLDWLVDELHLFEGDLKQEIYKEGQKLPLNL